MAMNIDRLIEAVETAAKTDLSYQDELAELLELKSRMVSYYQEGDKYSDWDLEIAAVSVDTLTDLMNEVSYDVYGRIYKGIDGYARVNGMSIKQQYINHMHKWYSGLTASSTEMAWEVISDLWAENESSGNNMSDGTYNKFEGLDKEDLENMCRYLHYSVKMYK